MTADAQLTDKDISFNVKLEWNDFIVLIKNPIRAWPDHIFRILFRALPLTFLAGALAGHEELDQILCGVLFVATMFGTWVLIPWLYRRQLKKSFSSIELRGYLSEDGIVAITDTAYTSVPWKHLLGYRVLDNSLLIHLTRDVCYLLPVKAFDGPDSRATALELVRRRSRIAHSRTVVTKSPGIPENLRYRRVPTEFAAIRKQEGPSFSGRIDMTDYARAEALSLAQSSLDYEKGTHRMGRTRYWIRAVAGGLIWMVFGFVAVPTFLLSSSFGVGAATALFAFLFVALVNPWLIFARIRAMMRAKRTWSDHSGSIGEHGIFTDDGAEASLLAWTGIVGFRAGKDMLIVYNSNHSYLTYPRAFFATDYDWQRALHYVARNADDFMPKGSAIHVPGIPACRLCGLPECDGDMLRFGDDLVCAHCKDVYIQRLREGVDEGR